MSILQLLNVNELNNTYEHTIDFPDLATQTKYFEDRINTSIDLPEDDYVYIRENRTIEVDKNKQELLGVNYLRFNNGSKWWYAFIISKTYINESVTSLEFEIDPIQTFMFDYTIKESFVTREHQDKYDNNFTPIYSLTPENIDIGGDYERYSHTQLRENSPTNVKWLLVLCTEPITNQTINPDDNYINNSNILKIQYAPTNLYAYLFPVVNGTCFYSDGTKLQDFSDVLSRSTATISIRILPYCPIQVNVENYTPPQTSTVYNYKFTFANGTHLVRTGNTNFGGINLSSYGYYAIALDYIENSNLNTFANFNLDTKTAVAPYSYTQLKSIDREPKLLTYPYDFIKISNYQDEGLIVKRQCVSGNSCNIKYVSSTGALQKSKLYVTNYLGDDEGKYHNNINNSINELTLANDEYTKYIASNKASATTGVATNIGIDIAKLGLATGIGVTTGNPFAVSNAISDVAGISSNVINHYYKIQDLKDTPPNISKYGNNGEFDLLDNNIWLYVDKFTILDTYKARVYNYFYHYGYSVNDFKLPNLKSRYYFNYIQMPDVNIETKIDNEYIQKIKSIYNNGITFWHYRDESTWRGVDDYTYENVEMNLIGV